MNLRKGLLVLFAIVSLIGLAGSAQAQSTPSAVPSRTQTPPAVTVARVYYADRAQLADLTTRYDVWEVHAIDGFVVAALTADEFQALLTQGYRLQIDGAKTIQTNLPRVASPGQVNGIPGFACYRTVEETYTTAQNIVAAHPNLAEWIDIGDSWDKITAGGNPGYDLRVLKLTNHARPEPKPKLFVMSAIHAREYTTAETNTRFAEYLVNHYGTDADATWLLDYNEIHLLLQSNPDGRKMAEGGQLWRKNVDNNYCANTSSRGADLNRNYPFHWGGPGASTSQCDETYRGSSAASEPETQAVVNYVRSQYPDLRNDDLSSAAPITTSGIFVDLHSYSQLVLWPWGDTSQVAPNGPAMQTLGRKFAYFNGYAPEQSVGLYPTSGTTDDTAYGELGVPAFTIEMGVDFFESCASFESTTYPANFPALLYAAKAARRPYQSPAGPDVINLTSVPSTATVGSVITLAGVADGTRYAAGEAARTIQAARYSIDAPAWVTDTFAATMDPADNDFDSAKETVQAMIDTYGWSVGRHIIFAEAESIDGTWGVPTAVFVDIVNGGAAALSPVNSLSVQRPGATVVDGLTMSNRGNLTATFAISVTGQTWPTSWSPANITLAPDQSATLFVTVSIPTGVPMPLSDTISIEMSGTLSLTRSTHTTLAALYAAYLPLVGAP